MAESKKLVRPLQEQSTQPIESNESTDKEESIHRQKSSEESIDSTQSDRSHKEPSAKRSDTQVATATSNKAQPKTSKSAKLKPEKPTISNPTTPDRKAQASSKRTTTERDKRQLPSEDLTSDTGVIPKMSNGVSSDGPRSSEDDKTPKNKPKASRLRQQKLPAWQPILTASTVIPTVFAVGIIFIPIGIALFLASNSVKELKLEYTSCEPPKMCPYNFELTEDWNGDVYLYYYLENFYQNHRRYVKSRNDKQYLGNLNSISDCEPFDKDASGLPIAPCGAVANSMFNDVFDIYRMDQSGLVRQSEVTLTTDGVLWDVDHTRKFKNPPGSDPNHLCDAFKGTAKPPNWDKPPCELGGFENVDFIIWMRTAALPNFRKLWRLVDRSIPEYRNGLPAGKYQLLVHSNYNVTAFSGKKAFILSTTSWAGGKNSFLGIAYLVVGSLAIVLGVIFIIIHVKFGHSMTNFWSDLGTFDRVLQSLVKQPYIIDNYVNICNGFANFYACLGADNINNCLGMFGMVGMGNSPPLAFAYEGLLSDWGFKCGVGFFAVYESANFTNCTQSTFANYQPEMSQLITSYYQNVTADKDNVCT
ncbi:hypothetical protein WR25_14279 [Diploscapter pachys]|uniref:Cell cycle control protein 50A n=1 Tax=Diploscapter pachys TaxID=2018661 RepID=A0A2A2LVT0_9BILA|nr:hypothetical protein WR25_14279 [Diploscapter pachys]